MLKIPLTNSNKFAIIDDTDFIAVSKHRWFLKKSHWCDYVATSIRLGTKVSTLRLHTLIAKPSKGFEVHHKNSNTLDNRRKNLKICTKIENVQLNYD